VNFDCKLSSFSRPGSTSDGVLTIFFRKSGNLNLMKLACNISGIELMAVFFPPFFFYNRSAFNFCTWDSLETSRIKNLSIVYFFILSS
jgi:hypothetical protein